VDDPNLEKVSGQIDARGTAVVYTRVGTALSFDAHAVPARGGVRRKICERCGPTETLSPDGSLFLATTSDNSAINVVDVASGKSTPVLQHSKNPLFRPRFSTDGKWVAFLMNTGGTSFHVMVAPFRGATSVSERDWITVTPDPGNVSQAFWSPDDTLIYYVIRPGGSSPLMARRLDQTRHPSGPPFRVFEFSERLHPQGGNRDAITAVPGRFIGAMSESNSNIWIMDLPK
jgi:Tol biopolymer transport system component